MKTPFRWTVAVLVTLPLSAAPDLHMEHLANAGVLLRCGTEAVVVDGLFREGVAGYGVLPGEMREALETGAGAYADVRLALVTHRHRDHFDAAAVQRWLRSNVRAVVGGPAQVAEMLGGASGQVWELAARNGRTAGGIDVRVFRVPHNEPHEKTIENNVYLVTICGKRIAVTGDAILSPQEFRKAGLGGARPDVVVAPWWFALSERGREILNQVFQSPQFWAVHGDVADREKWTRKVLQQYPQALIP